MFQEAPNSYWEAMTSPDKDKWLEASQEEYKGLTEMGVWRLVDHPSNCKTIKCRWTYVLKSDGRYKARLVTKGCTQVQGIDYEETFSPVVRYKSIRYLLTHTALQDWEIETMDVKLAYLHGVLNEEIYMEQPEGFIAQGEEDKVSRLVHSLYRSKQGGQVWNKTFAHTIKKKVGFDTIHSDAGVYVMHQHKGGKLRNRYNPHLICRRPLTFGRRPFQSSQNKAKTRQIVSYEGPWTCLILFGDLN